MTPEEQRAYNREYYHAHREEILAKKKVYDAANRERLRAYAQEYRKAHPEKYREYDRNCKERKAREETCKILKEHKQALADDPERLSTDFLLKLIRGES